LAHNEHNLKEITSWERVLRTLSRGRSGRALGAGLVGRTSAHWTCAYFKANFRKYVPAPVSAALRFHFFAISSALKILLQQKRLNLSF